MHRKSDSHFTWIAIAFLHKESIIKLQILVLYTKREVSP